MFGYMHVHVGTCTHDDDYDDSLRCGVAADAAICRVFAGLSRHELVSKLDGGGAHLFTALERWSLLAEVRCTFALVLVR